MQELRYRNRVGTLSGTKSRVLAQAFNSLPPLERARRYRQMAAEALALSSGAPTPEGRAIYLSLSNDWHALAVTVEHELGEKPCDAIRDAFAVEDSTERRRC